MSTRERPRHRDPEPVPAPEGPDGPEGGHLGEARRDGDAILAAFDAIVQRTLSGQSEAFLAGARQEGGQ